MTTYILRRLLILPLLMLGISLIVFILIQLAPGDPIASQYGLKLAELDTATVERLREQLGLNDPIMVQYGRYLLRLLQGDMGQSLPPIPLSSRKSLLATQPPWSWLLPP